MTKKDVIIYRKVDSVRRYYSEDFKRKVVEEYLSSSMTKVAVQRKYDLKGKCCILNWMRSLGYTENTLQEITNFDQLNSLDLSKKEISSENVDPLILQEELANLRKELAIEKLKNDGLNKLIILAEKEFKIPIRKKSNTK